MVEGRMTAPEDWPEQPASCCGQSECHLPTMQHRPSRSARHNDHVSLCLYWRIAIVSARLFSARPLFIRRRCNTCILSCEAQNESEPPFSLSLKYILGNSWHVFWPLTLLGHFHFPHTVRQNRQVFYCCLAISLSLSLSLFLVVLTMMRPPSLHGHFTNHCSDESQVSTMHFSHSLWMTIQILCLLLSHFSMFKNSTAKSN